MNEKLLIVNADDLGATVPVNDAIFALMDRGLVTSATLLAGGDAFEDAALRSKHYPNCSFGVHLNLTQLKPLRPTPALAPLLDKDGQMTRSLARLAWSPSLIRAAYVELCAQVERCLGAGVKVSHFDSHHHAHTNPWLLPALRALSRRYGIERMRGTINILPEGEMAAGRSMRKVAYMFCLRHLVGVRTPEGMGSFSEFRARLDAGLPMEWSSLELMVHPGATSAKGMKEDAMLLDGWQMRLPFPYRMGTYWDL
jgi:predicted glycoside hydrolase/deacetylase ChbG (UPF0249 family)